MSQVRSPNWPTLLADELRQAPVVLAAIALCALAYWVGGLRSYPLAAAAGLFGGSALAFVGFRARAKDRRHLSGLAYLAIFAGGTATRYLFAAAPTTYVLTFSCAAIVGVVCTLYLMWRN